MTAVEDRGPPAGLLEPDRGPGEQLRVAQHPRQVGRLGERVERTVGVARAMPCVTELQHHRAALARIADAELERCPKPIRRLLERERTGVRLCGEQVVCDRLLGAADGGSGRVVMGERREHGGGCRPPTTLLQRLGDAQVRLGLARGREPILDRPPDELVLEAVGQTAARLLDEQAASDAFVDRVEEHALAMPPKPVEPWRARTRSR